MKRNKNKQEQTKKEEKEREEEDKEEEDNEEKKEKEKIELTEIENQRQMGKMYKIIILHQMYGIMFHCLYILYKSKPLIVK